MQTDTFCQRLVERLGPDVVLVGERAVTPYLTDWRGIYTGRADAVIRPRTVADVSKALALCQEFNVAVVPRGGNTGLCGGATPGVDGRSVVFSMERMNSVRSVDTVANTMVAEAGCILGNLRRAAEEHRRMLPLSLAAEDSCQLGGNLATNAGGVNVVRYGMARELVLGIEAVLPNGEVYGGLRTLRKDNTGYDLKQLFIGSEGTLGIITAAALRLFARNEARCVVVAGVESPRAALKLFESLFEKCGSRLQAFEYFTGDCVDLVLSHAEGIQDPFSERHHSYVLVELADTNDLDALNALVELSIGSAIEDGLCLDAVVSTSLSQLQGMWRLREEISEAQRLDGPHLKHDVSVPIERIPEFMEAAEARLRALDDKVRLFVFGHFGDGNLHYNVSRPLGADKDWSRSLGKAVSSEIIDEVVKFGGSISAEHGIGQLKRDDFLRTKNPLELRMMREIKRAFDPSCILNPGKLL